MPGLRIGLGDRNRQSDSGMRGRAHENQLGCRREEDFARQAR